MAKVSLMQVLQWNGVSTVLSQGLTELQERGEERVRVIL